MSDTSPSAFGSLRQHTCKGQMFRNSGYGDIPNRSIPNWKQRGQSSLAVDFEMQRRWHAVPLTPLTVVPKLSHRRNELSDSIIAHSGYAWYEYSILYPPLLQIQHRYTALYSMDIYRSEPAGGSALATHCNNG